MSLYLFDRAVKILTRVKPLTGYRENRLENLISIMLEELALRSAIQGRENLNRLRNVIFYSGFVYS